MRIRLCMQVSRPPPCAQPSLILCSPGQSGLALAPTCISCTDRGCAQAEEAEKEARTMIGVYEEVARNFAGIPVVAGRKSRLESFAGANVTYTIEGMMGDRRALQVLTVP